MYHGAVSESVRSVQLREGARSKRFADGTLAVKGERDRIDCGSGRDKIRLNRNETKKIKHCETVYIFKDK